MSQANEYEWQMLALINQERTSRGLNELQLELRLNESAEDYSVEMLERNFFSHTGLDGSDPGDRMREVGFQFAGEWWWGENLAWQSQRGPFGIADDVQDLHEALMNSPGHRENILWPEFTLVGIGIETGFFTYEGYSYYSVMITQNYAHTTAGVLLDQQATVEPPPPPPPPNAIMGTLADDTLRLDNSGTINGLAGDDLLIGTTYQDTLNAGMGDDTVWASGGHDSVNGVDGHDELWAARGSDTVNGGNGDDMIGGANGKDQLSGGSGNDEIWGGLGLDSIFAGEGNDLVAGGGGADDVHLGNGNDTAYASDGQDTVSGSFGRDEIWLGNGYDLGNGGADSDTVYGGHGNDTLNGDQGTDLLFGGSGDDQLDGGRGDDRLNGGTGNDTLTGGSRSDQFDFSPGQDTVTDFDLAPFDTDHINLRAASGIDDWSDLRDNHMEQRGADVVITDDLDHSMTLENINLIDLNQLYFEF